MATAFQTQAAERPAAAAAATTLSAAPLLYPLMAKFGGVYPLKEVAAQPHREAEFKIIVDVISTRVDEGQPHAPLE